MQNAQPAAKKETKPARSTVGPIFSGIVLAIVIMAAFALSAYQHRFTKGYVVIGDSLKVTVDVAASDSTREKGLSGRAVLKPDEGMYFIFDSPDTYAFWMKDMRFPLDLIWIGNGKIADITTDVPMPVSGLPLPTYVPRVPVDRVLEVDAGFAQAHGLRIGLPVTEHLDTPNR
jgi:uncharacterized membrane protein (UPF0127 family)